MICFIHNDDGFLPSQELQIVKFFNLEKEIGVLTAKGCFNYSFSPRSFSEINLLI